MAWLLAMLAVATASEEDDRRVSILPLPTINFAPETGLAIGAVALLSSRPFAGSRPTTLGLEGTLTTNRQRILQTELLLFGPEDRWFLASNAGVMRYPEDFWGIGPQTPDAAMERYDASRVEVDLSALRQVVAALYIGPSWRLQSVYNITPAADGLLASGTITGAEGGVSSGLGGAAVWEQRQRPLTPAAGERYASVRQLWFRPAIGSDFRFSRLELDGRAYLGVGRAVVAVQGLAQLHSGAPPFRMMALLGGDMITRGYYLGRYRDQHLLAAQAELRSPLFWRLGGVVFAGAGAVSEQLRTITTLQPTIGGGLRLRVDDEEGTNLRADVAVGRGSVGVYFSFGEAF